MAIVYTIAQLDDKSLIPKNINQHFMKYKYEKYWRDLENRTLEHDINNKLNSVNPVFEWPKEFKENIEKNLSEGLVSYEDVEDIYDFFEM